MSSQLARITDQPIEVGPLLSQAGSDSTGAVLLFLGTVRDHNDGRPVSGMHYEAYQEMACEVLESIVTEAIAETGVGALRAVHRIGELEIGDISIAIVAASPHRDEAYRASRIVIEEVKKRLPVWKKEFYADGGVDWLSGRDPRTATDAPEAAAKDAVGGPAS